MTGLEALQSVQFVTVNERRLAVLDAYNWDCVVEWLETLENVEQAREARRMLKSTGGNQEAAGRLRWDEVRD